MIEELIKTVDENTLREKIIIPLLKVLEFKKVRSYHGSRERGKDIIYLTSNILKQEIYGVVVLKAKQINESVVQSEVLLQVQKAINEEYVNPDDPSAFKVKPHEVIVMTSCDITDDAKKTINSTCGINYPRIFFADGYHIGYLICEIIKDYNERQSSGNEYHFNTDDFTEFCEQLLITQKPVVNAPLIHLEKKIEGGDITQ